MEINDNICKRCLIREMADKDYIHSIEQYVDHIDEDIKTSKEEYEQRLELCKECENLLSGMCRICGCFVEMRAAVKQQYCPATERKW